MNKALKMILCAVMICALTVVFFLGREYFSSAAVIQEKSAELSRSRAAWEKTAADKEALQAELKTVSEELREAELTLSEAIENAEKLQGDIETLELEIAELKKNQ